jgi:hypothetical protein
MSNDERILLDKFKTRVDHLEDVLNKIHDLAGELGRSVDHPHVGAIQAWVHEVLPCPEKKT